MRCVTVVGTRPEFVQIGPLTAALRRRGHHETLVNTGQHYDDNMARVFFDELNLPRADRDLGVGSGSHATQTGQVMMALEPVLLAEKADHVIVYGDTNSTVAAALTAAKLHLPVVHVEAGLRSFDRAMPEEVNRVLTDHVSTVLFAPTHEAVRNLAAEGRVEGVHLVGDVRVDVVTRAAERARPRITALLADLELDQGEPFALATIHRAANTDDEVRLRAVLNALDRMPIPVVLPVHPRLGSRVSSFGLSFGSNVWPTQPLGFLDLIAFLAGSRIVVTDSGGLQKEAYLLSRPTITMRDSTEWTETVDAGWNRLSEPEPAAFAAAVEDALSRPPDEHPDLYGAPGVGRRMVDVLEAL